MSGLRPVPARIVIRFLESRGFVVVGQRGSHVKLRNAHNVTVVVPHHPGRDVKIGLLHKILKEAGLDAEDFLRER